MSNATFPGASHDGRPTQLTLKIWHPDCWTLKTTAQVEAGLISHGVYAYDDYVCARMTAYADQTSDIDDLVAAIEASELTEDVNEITDYFNPNLRRHTAGNATKELLVTYESKNSIYEAFVSRGFIPDEEVRIYDGAEYWTVIASQSRSAIHTKLEEIRQEMNAEISIESMKSAGKKPSSTPGGHELSERQREVLELAQCKGYYTWPRETSASDLAEELDISKTTLLEHLRKAEAKLLGNDA